MAASVSRRFSQTDTSQFSLSSVHSTTGPTDFKTKIVCTLGPASNTREVLERMVEAGMDVVRLNFSHGTHEEKRELFKLVRSVGEKYEHRVS
jgi:pyruvate kinase